MRISRFIPTLLQFLAPLAVWFFTFRYFISGEIPINVDTYATYAITKFYFTNIIDGIFPLWNPFIHMGAPFYGVSICNFFHPVMQLVPILKISGLNYYFSFITYLVVYFLLGVAGFYCLTLLIFKDRLVAYVAFVLMLFTGLTVAVFNQINLLHIFVPAVWFFYFLIKFARQKQKSDFLGLTFCLMSLEISYPFYTVTVLLIFGVLFSLFWFKGFVQFFKESWAFLRKNLFLVLVCFMAIAVAMIPIVLFKQVTSAKQAVAPMRHCPYSTLQQCYDRTLNDKAELGFDEITRSGALDERVHFRQFFSHQDKFSYGIDNLFYIPVFIVIVLIVSFFTTFDRLRVFLIIFTTILVLMALGSSGPLYKFFYQNIFYFRYFRNLFFFSALIIPLMILIAVGQLKALLDAAHKPGRNPGGILAVMVSHGGLLLFLYRQQDVLMSTYATIVFSFMVFVLCFMGKVNVKGRLIMYAMVFLIVLQPMEIFRDFKKNAEVFQCTKPSEHTPVQFSWVRPTVQDRSDCMVFRYPDYEHYWDVLHMRDHRGYFRHSDMQCRHTFMLANWMDKELMVEYARNKFLVYDQVQVIGDSPEEITLFINSYQNNLNVAYISESTGGSMMMTMQERRPFASLVATVLDKPTSELEVTHFDVNTIKLKTNFSYRRFLVYNDSYTDYWKVYIDGKPDRLYRANIAFKGVWVSPGEHTIEFRYETPGGGGIYIFVTVFFFCFFVYVLIAFWREKNEVLRS